MAAATSDRVVEWEGSSLADLVSALQASALPVRIEVIAPGPVGSSAGEVHLLAGGLADAFAGSLRRDDAMAALQRLEGARFFVECRLPDPESGSLGQAGPSAGTLKERSLPSLMRYCEDYVLTCRLEVRRGQEHATVNYKRGELVSTTSDGKDAEDRLPDMLSWPDGSYEIILATPELPPVPQRRRDSQAVPRAVEVGKADRKRQPTLPGTGARPPTTVPAVTSPIKMAAKGPDVTVPFGAAKASPGQAAAAQPKLPAVPPVSSLRLSPPPDLPGAARLPAPATSGKPALADSAPTQPMTTRGSPSIPAVPPPPQAPLPRPMVPAVPGSAGRVGPGAPAPLSPSATAAGAGQPATARVAPAAAAKPSALPPSAKPASAAAGAPAQAKTAAPPAAAKGTALPAAAGPALARPAPSAAQVVAPAKASTAMMPAKPAGATPVATAAKAPAPAASVSPAKPPAPAAPSPAKPSLPAPATKAGMPAVQAPALAGPAAPAPSIKPASAVAPPITPTPAPVMTAPHAAPVAAKPAAPPHQVAAAATRAQGTAEPAPAQVVRKVTTASRMGAAAAPAPATKAPAGSSNDLRPASGMIEAKPRRVSHPRPVAAPVEVAEEPPPVSRPMTPAPVTPHLVTPRRVRTAARRKTASRPVRIYVLMGLAIGIGIVVAYWLYFSMNVGR